MPAEKRSVEVRKIIRGEDMKRTDITTGRIVQRVLDAASKGSVSEIIITHGVDWTQSIERLVNNLYEYFPDSKITLKKLNFGYELEIKVVL